MTMPPSPENAGLLAHYGRTRPSLVALCVEANALACLERLLQGQATCASIDDLR